MRRFTKKIVALAIVGVMGISLTGNMGTAAAKKTKPVLPNKVSLKVKKTKILKITKVKKSMIKKTSWSVSNKRKLKLSSKKKTSVKLKALQTGTAKVKAVVKVGRKIYKLTTKVSISKASVTTQKPVKSPVTVPTKTPQATPSASPKASPTPGPTATVNPDIQMMEKLPEAKTYEKTIVPPSIMQMLDGTKVTTKEQWEERRQEIRCILQRYMYGIWRDGTGESVDYTISGSTITITIKKDGAESSFKATYNCPTGTAPEGGWPVIVSVGGIGNSYIGESGYATISFTPTDIASDNTSRTGAFYTLYPYDKKDWKEQTGSVMAWGWGCSKILDALEKGAGKELNISPVNTIVTGVSRYGKAAAAAGAFEERFKVSMPVCSGYGGMTMGRYSSDGLTYNLLPEFENDPKAADAGDLSAWKSTGGNEPINSLSGAGWFNEAYKSFNSYQNQPFDAHFIAALSARENHYLFIVTGINSDMWSSPPGFWWTYQEAKPAFDLMGLSDHLALQMHLNLHGIETVDLCKLFTFTDKYFYNKTKEASTYPEPWNSLLENFTLDDLQTCIFAADANKEAYEAGKPVDPSKVDPNPDNKINMSLTFGNKSFDTIVSRSPVSDALITDLDGDDAGKGFSFNYGYEKQYGFSYARFPLTLPTGKNIADYESVTFTLQTNSAYYGKRISLVVNPADVGMPEEIDYNYNTAEVSTAYNLSGEYEMPSTTAKATEITLPIDFVKAGSLDGIQKLECLIYVHMECNEAKAQYSIRNIKFNEL